MRTSWKSALAGAAMAVLATPAAQAISESKFNMTRGVTEVSNEVHDIHMLILWICIVASVVVYGVMFYAIFKFRKSKGAVAANFHENTTLEVLWTLVPALILVAMAVPATQAMIRMYDTSDADMTVKVTGHQWKWEYEYLGEGVRFFSNLTTPQDQIYKGGEKGDTYLLDVDEPLVLPVGKKVRFVITANDVLHAWWVPALGWKQDAIPGYINENWTRIDQPGTYRGQCAELCGRNHGFMPVVVEAKSEADYQAWLDGKKAAAAAAAEASGKTLTKDELMAAGEKVYGTVCAACHQANGQGVPGVFKPLAGSPIAKGGPIADHINIVLNGKAGTAMQAFGGQLSDADIAAVITYERNAWGNDTGDVVQAADVKAAR